MPLECCECKSSAICRITWGLYEYATPSTNPMVKPKMYLRNVPMYEENFCQFHSDELWKLIHGAVNMGYMHFTIKRL